MLGWVIASTVAVVLISSLAWVLYSKQKTITTPMTFNVPFSSDASSADSSGMTMFATSFLYMRLNVSPENIDIQQKLLLGYVPSENRDKLKKYWMWRLTVSKRRYHLAL
jgi:conjugal transfer pilus assembly protein TraE